MNMIILMIILIKFLKKLIIMIKYLKKISNLKKKLMNLYLCMLLGVITKYTNCRWTCFQIVQQYRMIRHMVWLLSIVVQKSKPLLTWLLLGVPNLEQYKFLKRLQWMSSQILRSMKTQALIAPGLFCLFRMTFKSKFFCL